MSSGALGVDLGTTWTAAVVQTGSGAGEPLALSEHGPAMPSVVALVDGEIVAGVRAERVALNSPDAAAREFKRRLGDTTPIVLGGTAYGAETLTGHLLAAVLGTARANGIEPSSVTLTHPAAWGEYKLDMLREAGRVANAADVRLLPEPVAAAQHYASRGRLAVGDTVVVYDFGGGTFDAAVVRLTAAGPELLGQAEGLERLGGIDVDNAVMAHVNLTLDGALSRLDRDDPPVRAALVLLRDECVAAKEALSADTDATINVAVPGLTTQVRLTRTELEAAIRPRFAETLTALDRVVASAGITTGDLAGVVLVGGSSRIPLVAELVGAHTGRPLLLDADPKLAIVLGAPSGAFAPPPPSSAAEQEPTMSAPQGTTPPPPPPPSGGPASGAGTTPPPPPPATASGGAGSGSRTANRRTEPTQRPAEREGLSGVQRAAGGVAAAAALGGAVYLWHDQITDAIFGKDAAASEAPPEAPAPAPAPPVEDPASMDVFDAPSGGGGGGGGARSVPSGGGGGGPAPQRMAAARDDDGPGLPGGMRPGMGDVPMPGGGLRPGMGEGPMPGAGAGASVRPPMDRPGQRPDDDGPMGGGPGQPGPGRPPLAEPPKTDAGFEAVRQTLQERLESWQPPEGAEPDEVADLRERLGGLLDRYQPRPGQTTAEAVAQLREEFDLRIDSYVQGEQLETLIEQEKLEEAEDAAPPTEDGITTDDPSTLEPGSAPDTGTPDEAGEEAEPPAEDATPPRKVGAIFDDFDTITGLDPRPPGFEGKPAPAADDPTPAATADGDGPGFGFDLDQIREAVAAATQDLDPGLGFNLEEIRQNMIAAAQAAAQNDDNGFSFNIDEIRDAVLAAAAADTAPATADGDGPGFGFDLDQIREAVAAATQDLDPGLGFNLDEIRETMVAAAQAAAQNDDGTFGFDIEQIRDAVAAIAQDSDPLMGIDLDQIRDAVLTASRGENPKLGISLDDIVDTTPEFSTEVENPKVGISIDDITGGDAVAQEVAADTRPAPVGAGAAGASAADDAPATQGITFGEGEYMDTGERDPLDEDLALGISSEDLAPSYDPDDERDFAPDDDLDDITSPARTDLDDDLGA